MNPFEQSARASKIAKLLDAADLEARRGGLDPIFHAAGIAEAWMHASPLHFRQLAILAAVRPPSPFTIAEFMDALNHRAQSRKAAS
jgi:hypothetical protein